MPTARYMKYLILLLCSFTALAACNDDTKSCDQDTRTFANARFRYTKPGTTTIVDTVLPKVTVWGLGKDSLIRKRTGMSGMQLPLDANNDTSRFYFQTDSTRVADTLTFAYKRQPHFVSAGCGVAMFYNIDTAWSTQNVVKSVQLNAKNITTINEVHIILHF